jgi:hypothetical protein
MELFKEDINSQINIGKTCLTCEFRERWQCGGKVIQYCGLRKSKRTENGKLKIKVTTPSCGAYKQIT